MDYLIGILGLAVMVAAYVGLGLADRGRSGCGGCALREDPESCGSCPVPPAGAPPDEAAGWPRAGGTWSEPGPGAPE